MTEKRIVKKAGCILINNGKVALVYRPKIGDYSFPKGHIENGETLEECAIRETEEETGRKPILLVKEPVAVTHYDNCEGRVEVYNFLAKDGGETEREVAESDKEETIWIDFANVEETVSYDNLKNTWAKVLKNYKDIIIV